MACLPHRRKDAGAVCICLSATGTSGSPSIGKDSLRRSSTAAVTLRVRRDLLLSSTHPSTVLSHIAARVLTQEGFSYGVLPKACSIHHERAAIRAIAAGKPVGSSLCSIAGSFSQGVGHG